MDRTFAGHGSQHCKANLPYCERVAVLPATGLRFRLEVWPENIGTVFGKMGPIQQSVYTADRPFAREGESAQAKFLKEVPADRIPSWDLRHRIQTPICDSPVIFNDDSLIDRR
jgi:hypothetical protein